MRAIAFRYINIDRADLRLFGQSTVDRKSYAASWSAGMGLHQIKQVAAKSFYFGIFHFGIFFLCGDRPSAKRAMDKSLYSSERQILLALLKEARMAAGISQSELARSLGWTQGMISKAEKGDRTLDSVELREWLRQLGQDLPTFAELWEQRISAYQDRLQTRPPSKRSRSG